MVDRRHDTAPDRTGFDETTNSLATALGLERLYCVKRWLHHAS